MRRNIPNISEDIELSIVIPCFNEEAVIEFTDDKLSRVLNDLRITYEVIYVDDGSSDRTSDIISKLSATRPGRRSVVLSRNFGHQVALTAGLKFSNGKSVVVIDADLQDPPELIPDMLDLWRHGYHVVYGQRINRVGESRFKLWTAKSFYRIINHLSDTNIPLDTGDFRLMDRAVVDALLSMPEKDRFIRGMVSWLGFRQVALPYHREARFAGETKYPLTKMIKLAADAILSFSAVPLKLATFLGFTVSGLAFLGIMYALVLRLFTNIWVPGWTLLFIATTFIGGIQLVCLGILGSYLGRIYGESKRRPLYFVQELHGFDNATIPFDSYGVLNTQH